ncbi:MAG: thioredoxin family protein [Parcubacteria group bacterium]|nr:thioredoxin family protein [Parcubacteria group bacterium]
MDRIIKGSEKLAVVFTQQGCGHCEEFRPSLMEGLKRNPSLPAVEVELSEKQPKCLDVAEKFRVDGTPTVLYFEKGALKKTVYSSGDKTEDAKIIASLGKE